MSKHETLSARRQRAPWWSVTSVSALALLGGAEALAGQNPPADAELPTLPALERRTLANGAELIVLSDHEQPVVAVSLVIRGGTSADPRRQVGVAALTAELLTAGVQGQLPERAMEDLGRLGARLDAVAGADHIGVSLDSPTERLDSALAVLANVVQRPQLPADRLAALVALAQEELAVAEQSPDVQASRAFVRELYGDHPYAKLRTRETLDRIDVQAVHRFHRTFFVPNNAAFVVAGDVTADRAVALLDRHFGGWAPGLASLPTYYGRPERPGREVVVVHVPGSTWAAVRAGGAIAVEGDRPWAALGAANLILGEGAESRLQRESAGTAASDVATALGRRWDAGYFEARARAPVDDLPTVLAAIVGGIDALGSAPPDPAEAGRARRALTETAAASLETPHQVAARVASALVQGTQREPLKTWARHVAALTPEEIRAAAQEHLDATLIVVAGDAARLHDAVRAFGPVTLRDTDGRRVALDDVASSAQTARFDASGLAPMSWDYEVIAQNWPAGALRRQLRSGETPGTLELVSEAVIGPREVQREVTFDATTFEAREAEDRLRVQGRLLTVELAIDGGRVTGRLRGPGGEQSLDADVPDGALLGEMSEVVLWVMDLAELDEARFPLVGQDGRVTTARLRARGEREVRVPAGIFDTYEVELEVGGQRQRIFVRKERPRYTVKIELVGQPVETVLTRVVEGPGNP